MRNALLAAALLLASATAAQAAEPLVPPTTKSQLGSLLEQFNSLDLAYVPTRAPKHYIFIGFNADSNHTNFRLADERAPESGPKQRSIFISVDRFKGKLPACVKGYKRKLQASGSTIYLRGTTGWRCVRTPSNRLVRIFGGSAFLSAKDLALTLGSFKRFQ